MISVDATWDAANSDLAKQPYVSLEIDGYARKFTNRDPGITDYYPWIAEDGVTDIEYNTSPLDGSSELQDVTVTVLDFQGLITADMPSITLEGRTARIKVWFPGVDVSHAVTLFTGKLDLVQCSNVNTTYDFVLKDTRVDLKQLVYLTGDDGQPVDSSHLKTVVAHPLDILKDILLNQLALDTSLVDIATIDAYRDGPFAGAIFQFSIDSAPEAKDFIENQLMKPLGGCLRSTSSGILKPYFLISLAGSISPVQSFDADELVDIPLVGQSDIINTLDYKFDKEGSEYKSESVLTDADSIAKYGQATQIVESDGMRSGYQAFFLANIVSREIFNRLASKNPTFDAEVLWTGCKVEASDIISITHPLMPDRKAGVMGVTDAWFQVQSLKLSISTFTATFTLVDVSTSRSYGAFKIAPDSQVDWTSATSDEKSKYMFIADATGKYSDTTTGNPLG